MSDKDLLYTKLQQPANLKMTEVLSQSFEVFGKKAGMFIAFMILGVFSALVMLMFATSIDSLLVILLLTYLFVLPVVQIGVAGVAHGILKGEAVLFSDFFKKPFSHYSRIVFTALLVGIVTSLVTIAPKLGYYVDYYHTLEQMLASQSLEEMLEMLKAFMERNPSDGWVDALTGLFGLYITVVFSLGIYIAAFFNVSPITAVDVSVRMMNKVVFKGVALNIILSILGAAGILFFGVGVLVTFPIYLIGSFLVFHQLFGDLLYADTE